jgi:hypothetical protein
LKTEKENALLKETVAAQQCDLENMKKTSLTESQTTALLEELVLCLFLVLQSNKMCVFAMKGN